MRFMKNELEFLSAWAHEEWEPACYQLPAHKLQLEHRVSGASLIVVMKAWTEAEGKNDQDILRVPCEQAPTWPWSTEQEFQSRLEEAEQKVHRI